MTQSVLVVLAGLVGTAVINAVVIGIAYGVVITRLKAMEGRVEWLSENFVHHTECKGINDTWKVMFEGMLERRRMTDKQNLDDHDRLLEVNTVIQESIEKINACLVKIQKKMMC